MLSKLWPKALIVSIVFAIFSGNIGKANNSVFESAKSTLDIILMLVGTMSLWTGLMNIIRNLSIMDKIMKLLNPLIMFLFPELRYHQEIKKDVSMNIVSNMLGLGNAATPAGLKAMKAMQEINEDKEKLSDSMKIFLIINASSIQIIPTTVIAIRKSLNSTSPTSILLHIWFATISAMVSGVILMKLYINKSKGVKRK